MNLMRNKKLKWYRVIVYALSVTYITLVHGSNVYADTIQDSVLVTGTKELAADALVAIQIVSAPVGLMLFGWFKLQESLAGEDSGEQTKFKKLQRVVFVAIIVIELIGTLAGTLGGYYGIKFS